jgi:SAM-dependent methyltransferase
MKSYMAAAISRAARSGVVVDLGCGVGHDLARLVDAGTRPIGIDASETMLSTARGRLAVGMPLARADVATLPLRDASVDACRVERVLQHVDQPDAVVREVARVLRPAGFLAVFEPDYSTFWVASDQPKAASFPAGLLRVRHPTIGRDVVGLLDANGFRIDDVVTESSRCDSFDDLPVAAEAIVARAALEGRIDPDVATAWVGEQRARTADGSFRAVWDKILVVAHRV